jgi:hypothetical protein
MVANGTIGGFMLGDELIWQGCTVDALTTLAEAVRADFPMAPTYYNENVPVVLHGVNSAGHAVNFTVPPALTWFSFDYYHYDGAHDGKHVSTVREVYEQHVYPKLLPHQRVLLCPGAFALPPGMPVPGGFACNLSCFDVMRASDAAFYFDWARADKQIVGLAAWEWNDSGDRRGAMNLPQTRLAWETIGRQIMKTDDDGGKKRRPFSVLWNSPWPSCCGVKGKDANNRSLTLPHADPVPQFVQHNITVNAGGPFCNHGTTANPCFNGKAITTIYAEQTGMYPRYSFNKVTNEYDPVFGGIPQLANVTAHLAQWAKEVVSMLPDANTSSVPALGDETYQSDLFRPK